MMPISTTNSIPGYEVFEYVGVVRGGTTRTRNVVRDILAGFRSIIGGEVKEYTQLQAHTREQAFQRIMEDAKAKGANGIIGFKVESSEISQGVSEIFCYGTGVKLKKL